MSDAKGPQKSVMVIGAGVVGTATALWLAKDGHAVTLVDRRQPGTATSFGNAGSIAVGSVYPVSTPGNWKQVPKMLFDPAAPLALKPSHLVKMLPFVAKFLAAASKTDELSRQLRALTVEAGNAHTQLMKDHRIEGIVKPVGWLKVYKDEAGFAKTADERRIQAERGVRSETLNADELRQLEPNLSRDYTIGYHQPDNGFVTSPVALTTAYAEAFRSLGGTILHEQVMRMETGPEGVTKVVTDLGIHTPDEIVICTGAYTQSLTRPLGLNILLEAERGYHVNIAHEGEHLLRRPTTLGEHSLVLAPMRDGMRLTTGSEFNAIDAEPDFRRIRRLIPMARKALPGLEGEVTREWVGNRPSTPDSLPVLGRSGTLRNVYFNVGHGHIGLTLSARTGRLVADLISGKDPGIDLTAFRAERF